MRFFNDQYNRRREAAGLSFDDIANLVGVKKSMAYAWANSSQPRSKRIPLIAKALKCRVTDICDMKIVDEIAADREQMTREHYGADVWEEVSLMESLQFELATIKKNDPDYRIKVLGFEDQIERCKSEIERKTKEAKTKLESSPAVSVNGNGNAVGHSAMVLSDTCPYGDEPLSAVELFRGSLIIHLMELKDIPQDILMRVLYAVKNFRKSPEAKR